MLVKLLAATALFATPALAQDAPQDPPKRVRSVLLYGEEQCPKPQSADEIVVCATVGDSPYRIPKRFREPPAEGPTGQAWSRRLEAVEEVNRQSLPNSCSTVGTGGQTGCSRKALQQWYQEKLERERRNADVP